VQRRPTTPAGRFRQWAPIVLVIVGAAVGLALLRHVGWRPVAAALAALGVGGLVAFCAATLGVLALLGYGWFVIAPGLPARALAGFVFGRVMREVAADILPFSQIGGFVVGARGAVLLGATPVGVVASAVVDLAAEMIGQLLFTAVGLAVLVQDAPRAFPHRLLDPVLAAGLALGLLTAGLFMAAQYGGLALVGRFNAPWVQAVGAQAAAVQATLRELYRRPWRVAASIGLHFIAWLCAAAAVWMVLGFMGAPLSYPRVVALESLIYLLRSAAFFGPGGLGVLEGGYVLLGPVFGLSAEIALGLSLAKRARDLVIGAPSVVIWQALEGRRLVRRGGARTRPGGGPVVDDARPADAG
jgi:putative membrane protein